MNVFKLILGLLLATALVVFGAQNTQSMRFEFIAWETPSAPVVLALAIAVLAGVLLSWIVSVPGRFHSMRERRSLQHEVHDHERSAAATPDDGESTRQDDEPRS